ncbi:MAG: outer membrane lipoprotein-sorting protein, partial [Desulfobacteraceae bacterium]
LLGEEECGGLKAFKVESIPQNQWLYSRIINWICKDTLLPIERHFYDVRGNLWKKQAFGELGKFRKVPTPSLI